MNEKEILTELEYMYADCDLKFKVKHISEDFRKFFPFIEFEDNKIKEFNEIKKKLRAANTEQKNLGCVWIFPNKTECLKKKYIPLIEGYTPAYISPLPDARAYMLVLLNKNQNVSIGDYVNIKKAKTKVILSKTISSKKDYVLIPCIEEIEKIDKIKAFRIKKDLQKEFKEILNSMAGEEKLGEQLAASALSAHDGLGYMMVSASHGARNLVFGIFSALQSSLPPVFQNHEINLNFQPNNLILKDNILKIILKPEPLYTFSERIIPYTKACTNQTISSFGSYGSQLTKEKILFFFRNANMISRFETQEKFKTHPEINPETPILDEEIKIWMISQRNIASKSFNSYIEEIFIKKFSKVIQENFDFYFPEDCLNLIAKNTVVMEGCRRSFDSFHRQGTPDTEEEAKEFVLAYLKDMSSYTMDVGKMPRHIEEKRKKEERLIRKFGETAKLYNTIEMMAEVSGVLPYDETISAIEHDMKYDRKTIESVLNYMNKNHPWIRVYKEQNKIVDKSLES